MLNRRAILWLTPALLVSLAFVRVWLDAEVRLPHLLLLALVWALTILTLLNHPIKQLAAAKLKVVRQRHPILVWSYLLVGLFFSVLLWEMALEPQPAQDYYLLFILWMLMFLASVGVNEAELRAIGQRLQRSPFTGVMITLTTLVVIVLVIEVLLHLFLVMSDGVGVTHMFKRWQARYWHPINSLGYRDYEPSLALPDDVQRVLVVGDSFAAGQGIEAVDDVFAHRLGALLGERYAVNLVAQPGWDTDEEWEGLLAYPVQPDILILSHYLNDVLWLPDFDAPITTLPDSVPLAILVQSLEIPNFLYWRGYFGSRADTYLYNPFYDAAYQNPALWQQHEQLLSRFVTYANQQSARLVVIVWPMLKDVAASQANNQKVVDLFAAQGVPVVDMAALLRDRQPEQLVVNVFDAHPNAAAHALAAEALHAALEDR